MRRALISDIFNGIQSLIRRYLVVKIADETRYNRPIAKL